MPLCLHGTLGAAYALLKNTKFSTLNFKTKNSIQLSTRRKENNVIQVQVSKQENPAFSINKNEIYKMLNISSDEIDFTLPFEIFSVGSSKLLIPLKAYKHLSNLKPNFHDITKWSMNNKINGLYVYTKDSQDELLDFYARGFNPITGHNEDAATGVAAAALALSIRKSINVGQGIFTNRSSRINVTFENPEVIWVGGKIKE